MIRELQLAVRMLRRTPAVTAAALLCLACGIGVTVTIFSALSGIFLRPLPYPDARHLIVVHVQPAQAAAQPARTIPLSWEEFTAWRDNTRALTGLAIWISRYHELSGPEAANERAAGAVISPKFFDVVGIHAARGVSTFNATTPNQVLLSDGIWHRRYGANPDIVGRSVIVFGRPHVVVGIMPSGAVFPEAADVWTPINSEEEKPTVRRYAGALGRLAPGVTIDHAQGELARISQQSHRDRDGMIPFVVPLREELVGSLRKPILMFQGAALLVLLIACANVANLMLARGTTQVRDVAIRLALGAGHRVIRFVLAESLVLSLIGGALGTVVAFYGVKLLALAFPEGVPSYIRLAIDPLVLGVSLLVAAVTGVLFGLAPALRTTRVDPAPILSVGGRTVPGAKTSGFVRDAVVAVELALSLIVMIGATLLIRSDRVLEREVAFDGAHVLSVRVPLPYPTYDGARRDNFYGELFARIRALPGVQAVGSASWGAPLGQPEPLLRMSFTRGSFRSESVTASAVVRDVSPGYLRALGIRLLRGREFTLEERNNDTRPAVINEILAREQFSDVDPIGQRVTIWDPSDATNRSTQTFTIVGVAENFREERPARPLGPAMYVGRPAFPGGQTLAIRTTVSDPLTLVPAVRGIVRDLDPRLFVYMVNTLDRTVATGLWRQRLQARVLAIFAAVAVVLALFGMYSVISYAAAQRTHELGVRAALGATRRSLIGLIGRGGVTPIVLGLSLGVLGALSLAPVLNGLLYDIEPKDIRTFVMVPAVLAAAAFIAMILPAFRAARVDPLIAIRD